MRPVETPRAKQGTQSTLDYHIQTLADAIITNSTNGVELFLDRLNYAYTTLALEVTNRKLDHPRPWVMTHVMSVFRKVADEFHPKVEFLADE